MRSTLTLNPDVKVARKSSRDRGLNVHCCCHAKDLILIVSVFRRSYSTRNTEIFADTAEYLLHVAK